MSEVDYTDNSFPLETKGENRNLWKNGGRKVFGRFSSAGIHSCVCSCVFAQLLLALFRIIEPTEGTIFIDGVDITTIGLHDCMFVLSLTLRC